MRTKTSPCTVQSRLQGRPEVDTALEQPTSVACHGLPIQNHHQKGKPPRPPSCPSSRTDSCIAKKHSGKPVLQIEKPVDVVHPSSKTDRIAVHHNGKPFLQMSKPVDVVHPLMREALTPPPSPASTEGECTRSLRHSLCIAGRHTGAIDRMQILASGRIPDQIFAFLCLPVELRFKIYDEIAADQTFFVTSQTARGSTFTNLSYSCKELKGELQEWAKARPHLILGLRGGFVDFDTTTFLVDYWKDRKTVPARKITSRFHALGREKICVGELRNLCVDIRTDSSQNGREVVLEFLRSVYGTFRQFQRLQKLSIVYDSSDNCIDDWFLHRGPDWKGVYERKEGFLRTVWRMLPAALGVCHWSWPCTCCAAAWKLEVRGFDVRNKVWMELPLEKEMYWFSVTD